MRDGIYKNDTRAAVRPALVGARTSAFLRAIAGGRAPSAAARAPAKRRAVYLGIGYATLEKVPLRASARRPERRDGQRDLAGRGMCPVWNLYPVWLDSWKPVLRTKCIPCPA